MGLGGMFKESKEGLSRGLFEDAKIHRLERLGRRGGLLGWPTTG